MRKFKQKEKDFYAEKRKERKYKRETTTNKEKVKEFIEISGKKDSVESRYFLDNERGNSASYNYSTDRYKNKINYLLTKKDSPTKESSTEYNGINLKPRKPHQSEQRENVLKETNDYLEIPRKQNLNERRFSIDNEKRNTICFNDLKESSINKISNYKMKNDLPRKDSSTQYSKTNLWPGEYIHKTIISEVVSPQHTRTCNKYKENNKNLTSLPSYYVELIPKVNRSRTTNILPYLRRREKLLSYNRPEIIQDGYNYSRSQHFSSKHQIKHETFSDVSCVKKKKYDHSENRAYFINCLETKPFKIGQIYQTGSKNSCTQSELHLKKKKHNTEGTIFNGMKSESEFINKYNKLNQEMKYERSHTILHDQPLTRNYNFLNVHKAHSFSGEDDNIQNKLEHRNKRQKPLDMISEMKSGPQPINRSQFGAEENQEMKYHQNYLTALKKQASASNNSFQSVLKENPDSQQKSKAYYEAVNYTKFLIQKLSEKSSNKNMYRQEQIDFQLKLCDSSSSFEEKCTQTLTAAPSEQEEPVESIPANQGRHSHQDSLIT